MLEVGFENTREAGYYRDPLSNERTQLLSSIGPATETVMKLAVASLHM